MEDEDEASPLITSGAQKCVKFDDCRSPTQTMLNCSKISVTKDVSDEKSHFHKRKSSETVGGLDGNRKMNFSVPKSGIPKISQNMDVIGCNLQKISMLNELEDTQGIEKIEDYSLKSDKKVINLVSVPIPLPIIHEEFRCLSEHCIFRTSVRQELIQHIIVEHDD